MTLKLRLTTLSCAGAVLVILSFFAYIYPLFPVTAPAIPEPPPSEAIEAEPIKAEIPEPMGYIVKDADGYIGVYNAGEQEKPIYITEIVVEKLRKSDQNVLKKGIFVDDTEELAMLLEDFGS